MRAMRLSFKEAMIGLCVGFVIAYLVHEFGWNKKSDGMEELNRAFGDPPIMSETDIDTIDSICKQYGLETESEEHLSPGICLRVYTSKDGKDALTVIYYSLTDEVVTADLIEEAAVEASPVILSSLVSHLCPKKSAVDVSRWLGDSILMTENTVVIDDVDYILVRYGNVYRFTVGSQVWANWKQEIQGE